jgi:hypothetical protein
MMVPRCVYFTIEGVVHTGENQKGKFLTGVCREICYHSPDLARISDDHTQIDGQIYLKVKALALRLILV